MTAMLAAKWLTVCNCAFVSETVSRNYSDIGTIEIAAYINTPCAHVDAITSDNGFDGVRATSSDIERSRRQIFLIRDFKLIAMTRSPRYLRNLVFKNQFLLDGCSD